MTLLATPAELAAASPPSCGVPLRARHLPGGATPESEGMRMRGFVGVFLQFLGRAF